MTSDPNLSKSPSEPSTKLPSPACGRGAGGEGELQQCASSFAQQAQQASPGIVREFVDFLLHNKKWWLAPIIVVLLLVGVLFVAAILFPAAAPFIYTLF